MIMNAMSKLGGLCALLSIFSFTTPAAAQSDEAEAETDGSFSVQLYEPAIGHDPMLTIESARTVGHLGVTAGLWIGYQHRPFSVYQCQEGTFDGETCELDRDNPTPVVDGQLEADVWATLSLWEMLQIGLAIPVVLYSGGDGIPSVVDGNLQGSGLPGTTSLGDIRLHLKWTAPFGLGSGEDEGFGLAIAPVVTFPVGNAIVENGFMGSRLPTVHAQVLMEYRWRDLQVGARVGYRWREEAQLFSTEVGMQLTYAAGVSWDFHLNRPGYGLRPVLEIFGANGFSTELDANPLEIDLGLHATLARDFIVTVGAGAGLIAAVGVPQFRVYGGFMWAPRRGDSDRDGVVNAEDQCPNEAEDEDGFEDSDGCPDLDNDRDGFPDDQDRCPDDAEDRDQFEDDDGCPEPDNDGDGVNDGYDSCPDEPEDLDGFEDENGCPDLDHDGDNIPEPRDHCPYEQEDTDGFGDEDGCPESDFDGDGIGDDEGDICADEPEDFDGFEDDDGCPDLDNDHDLIPDARDRCDDRPESWNDVSDDDGCPDGRAAVTFSETSISLAAPVTFEGDTATLSGRTTTIVLDALANAMRFASTMRVRIVAAGPDAALAQRRAQAVRAHLVGRGVAEGRFEILTRSEGPTIGFEIVEQVEDDEDDAPPPEEPPAD